MSLVISCLEDVLTSRSHRSLGPIEEATQLVGPESVLDSLGLVALIIDLEQRIDEEYGESVTLADDRALSQTRSPFRTVQTLADYVAAVMGVG